MNRNKTLISLVVVILDYLVVLASFLAAYNIRDQINGTTLIDFNQFTIFAGLVALVYVLVFAYIGLYNDRIHRDLVDQLFAIIIGSVAATGITGAGIYFGKNFDYSRLIIGFGLILAIFNIWFIRIIMRQIEIYWYSKGIYTTKILLIGSGTTLKTAIEGYDAEQNIGYKIVGVVLTQHYPSIDTRFQGYFDEINLDNFLTSRQIDQVVWADDLYELDSKKVIDLCEEKGITFKYVPNVYNDIISKMVSEDVAGFPVIELRPTNLAGWMIILKRLMDIVISALGLVALLPLFAIVAMLIKLDTKGPIFFVHKRVGRYGKEFDLIKFRSMAMVVKDGFLLHASENEQVEKIKEQQLNYKLKDDPRVTRVGRLIRKTSIDELPQLINVLKGEMSLVGPRAYLRKELDSQLYKYPATKSLVRRLLTVKPGLTGLWQISGRSNVDFTERVAMDAHYATEVNIWLDIKLIIQTIPAVVKGSGAM